MTESRWLRARALAKSGDASGALSLLGEAVRRGELDALELERAGALARKLDRGSTDDYVRVAVLGECTTSWLANSLAAVALGDGQHLRIHEGEFDNILQELHSDALARFAPQVVVLLPFHRPDADAATLPARVEHFRGVQATIAQRLGARLVQVGFDWIDPGPDGFHLSGAPGGLVSRLRHANDELRRALPSGAYFVDLPAVSGDLGRRVFYDLRRYFWTKQPFSESGVQWLAQHVWAGARAVLTGPKKLLALDLDNTLWGGVVGELGATGIEIGESPQGEAHRSLQRFAKGLTRRGILLAVISKNDEAEARSPFTQNPEMQLGLEDVAAFEANWGPKSESLLRVAERLRLGADSFVFVDDNPTEREEVRQRSRGVAVVELPSDVAEYARMLSRQLYFEAAGVTGEDQGRAEQYRSEAQREEQRAQHTTLEEYLRSLELRADVRDIDDADTKRVLQLIGKTNQFNLTTPRYSEAELSAILAQKHALGLSLRLRDRFGDYGLILVLLGRPLEPTTLLVDTFLMSCRAIARTVEEYAWGKLLERAKLLGYERVRASYRKTTKNQLVERLYERLGLTLLHASETERVYELVLEHAHPPITFVLADQPSSA